MKEDTKRESSNSNIVWYIVGFILGLILITFLRRQKSRTKLSSEEKNIGVNLSNDLNARQALILNEVKKKGIISPAELYLLVPDVSPRTLRRDMNVLMRKGLIFQEGTTKSTTYRYAK